MDSLKPYIRNIRDFPQAGIQFKDITPLLKQPVLLDQAIEALIAPFANQAITAVVGIEARGFIFGSLVAAKLGKGFVPLRKAGKLPYHTKQMSYQLEYARSTLEIHTDALNADDHVLVVDDLLATGGTMLSACELIQSFESKIVACACVIELAYLGGREPLKDYTLHALVNYD